MTLEAKLTRIEPCQKCGQSKLGFCQVERFVYIECKQCNAHGPLAEARADAVKQWNKKQGKEEKELVH